MGRFIDRIIYGVGLITIAYVAYVVPIGEKTLLQHIMALAGTDQAQTLGHDVHQAVDDARERVGVEVREHIVPAIQAPLRRAMDQHETMIEESIEHSTGEPAPNHTERMQNQAPQNQPHR